MILYQRSVTAKIWTLRIACLIIGIVSSVAFKLQHANLGYFTAVVLLAMSIIVVDNLIIQEKSFRVDKYYLFGWIKCSWQFNETDPIKLSTYGPYYGEQGEEINADADYPAGCLLMIVSIFIRSTVTRKQFKIEKYNSDNKRTGRVHLMLTHDEFFKLQRIAGM